MTIVQAESPQSFQDIERATPGDRPAEERLADWREVELFPDRGMLRAQTARCINCGIPYCHGSGCPLGI